MHIEYVLIEKNNKNRTKPSKNRITALLKKEVYSVSSEIITIQGKRKLFELRYKITCCPTTEGVSCDNIYNIYISAEYKSLPKCAELLETINDVFRNLVNIDSDYHLIVASDGLSEYYCNKIYPKYQHLERQLRHLIFKVVTKSYGNLWTKQTLPDEMKKSLKDTIKIRSGYSKEDILIEQALHEMTMGQLIEYLFYGKAEVDFKDYIDEYYPIEKLKELGHEELLTLIEKSRKKSIWNIFLAKDIDIEEPKKKLTYLRENRNKVAHCKQFYFSEYSTSLEYINIFLPKIDAAIEKATITQPITAKDILLGFGEFTVGLANLTASIGQMISPAITAMAEISATAAKMLGENIYSITETISKIKLDIPQVDIPKIDFPKIDIPKIDFPRINYPKINFPKIYIPKIDFPELQFFDDMYNLASDEQEEIKTDNFENVEDEENGEE